MRITDRKTTDNGLLKLWVRQSMQIAPGSAWGATIYVDLLNWAVSKKEAA